MRDKKTRSPFLNQFAHSADALHRESHIADRQGFIDNEDIRFDSYLHGERESVPSFH